MSKRLLKRVAELAFVENMKQAKILESLREEEYLDSRKGNLHMISDLTKQSAKWLLREHEARQKAFKDKTPEKELATDLCNKFDLLDARVIPGDKPTGPRAYPELVKRLGYEAANYFDDYVDSSDDDDRHVYVSISGGQSILDMVESLPERRRSNVSFFPSAIIGRGLINWTAHPGPETNATLAWARSGRIPNRLFYGTVSPIGLTREDIAEANVSDSHAFVSAEIVRRTKIAGQVPAVKKSLEHMSRNINFAIAGLGLIEPEEDDQFLPASYVDKLTMMDLLTSIGISSKRLLKERAIGDFSYTIFNKNGKTNPKWEYFLTSGHGTKHSGIDFYRDRVTPSFPGRSPTPVMVIAASNKWPALVTALQTKMFNVLITNSYTAKKLMALPTPRPRGRKRASPPMA